MDECCRGTDNGLMLHFGMYHDSSGMEAKSLHFLVAFDNGACENTQTSIHDSNSSEIETKTDLKTAFIILKKHTDACGRVFMFAGITLSARMKMLYSEELSVLLSSLICSPAMDLCIPE